VPSRDDKAGVLITVRDAAAGTCQTASRTCHRAARCRPHIGGSCTAVDLRPPDLQVASVVDEHKVPTLSDVAGKRKPRGTDGEEMRYV
jgi:hypothetical protein